MEHNTQVPPPPKEKKPIGKKIKFGVAKGLSFILGEVHFTLKSTADIVANIEAKLASDLTGRNFSEILEDRHVTTEIAQEQVIKMLKSIRPRFRASSDVETDVINETAIV